MKKILLFAIHLYQKTLSPLLGRRCRFYPTCSQYVKICLNKLPLHLALSYGIIRLIKCNPFHPGGHDPPPQNDRGKPSSKKPH